MVQLHTEKISFGPEQAYSGYVARPERVKTPLPGVLVLQEAWGVDAHIEDVAQRLATAGYVALAPEVYARRGQLRDGFDLPLMAELKAFLDTIPPDKSGDMAFRDSLLAQLPKAEGQRIGAALGRVFQAAGAMADNLPPVQAAAQFMRDQLPATRGEKIMAVGFCMGGGLATHLAAHDPKLAGAVCFYGNAPPADAVANITCPVLGLYGEHDPRVNAGIAAFAAAMAAHSKRFTHHIYPKARHAFYNDTRGSYDVAAARHATAEMLKFLRDQVQA